MTAPMEMAPVEEQEPVVMAPVEEQEPVVMEMVPELVSEPAQDFLANARQ